MNKDLARYDDPSFPTETITEIKERLSPEFLSEICMASGIEGDREALRHELAKVLMRYTDPHSLSVPGKFCLSCFACRYLIQQQ